MIDYITPMKTQVVKVVCSKDLKFLHIDAGIDDNGGNVYPQRPVRKESYTTISNLLSTKRSRNSFPDLRRAALTIKFTFV